MAFSGREMQPHVRSASEYLLKLVAPADLGKPPATGEKVLDLVWRFDFNAPGFALLDIQAAVDTHTLRSCMVALKRRLSKIAVDRGRKPFLFRSMARFDQQVTTKFHLDGAPAESLLILGYEPSSVGSRLFLADYSRAAFELGITPQQFLNDFNPMYRRGEELLGQYVTELPQPTEGRSRILLVNNGSLPYSQDRTNSLGVMHMAIIVAPNEAARRIVNSTMLVTEGEEISPRNQEEFVRTDKVSQKDY